MSEFSLQIKKSFQMCKEDISALQIENRSLKEDLRNQKDKIAELENKLQQATTTMQAIQLAFNMINTGTQMQQAKPEPKKKKMDTYDSFLQLKAKMNKKDILKQKILSMITDHGIILAELRFLYVEQYRYSSKATFYNYLKELEHSGEIYYDRSQGKNIIMRRDLNKQTSTI